MGEALARMCLPWIIGYVLAYKMPPPKFLKKFTWIFLAAIIIEGSVTIIFAITPFVGGYYSMYFVVRYFYYAKMAFWGLITAFMIPVGMFILHKQRPALEGYEEV